MRLASHLIADFPTSEALDKKGVDCKMITNKLEPSRPIHPGEVLKEELEYRGISQKEFSEQ